MNSEQAEGLDMTAKEKFAEVLCMGGCGNHLMLAIPFVGDALCGDCTKGNTLNAAESLPPQPAQEVLSGREYRAKTGATLIPRLVDDNKGIVLYTNSRTEDLHEVTIELFLTLVAPPLPVEAKEKDFHLPSWNQIELQVDFGPEPSEPKPTLPEPVASEQDEIARLTKALESEEASCLEEIKNRDEWEERAEKLADAVSDYFGVPIGEWSNINDPVEEAHKILNGEYKTKAEPQSSLTSIPAQTFEEWWKVFNKSEYARTALGIGTEKAPYGSSEYFILRRCAEATWNADKGSL